MNPIITETRRSASPDPSSAIDGRTARRDRNRSTVLDAVIDLFEHGNPSPTVHEIAHRSGVSLRSVYRYFDDVEALVTAAIERRFEQARPRFSIDRPGEGALRSRIERFCQSRVLLFEDLRVSYFAATVRSRIDSELADGLTRLRRALSQQVEEMFAPEFESLDADELRSATLTLDLLSQFDSLELLRQTRGLSVDDTVEYLVDAFGDILG